MRRGLVIASAIALLLTLAVWLTAKVEKSPVARKHPPKYVPSVVAGHDRGSTTEAQPVVRDDVNGSVRCRYDGEGDPGKLTAMGATVVNGSASGNDLELLLPPGTWSVLWQAPSGAAVPLGQLEIEAGDTEACQLEDGGWGVDGHVRASRGGALANAEVNVCGNLVQTDTDGAFHGISHQRICTVRAQWRDGMLARRSDPQQVEAFDARDVTFTVDDTPLAGMGLAFHMSARGARVLQVYPDTPAEDAGVEEGDFIVAVDGTSVIGMTDDAFVSVGTGKEGSTIRLDLDHQGERKTVSFRRERIEKPTDTGNANAR